MKREAQSKIGRVLFVVGLLMIWTAVLSYMQTKDEEARMEDAYRAGAASVATLFTQMSDVQKEEIALKWWYGSADMMDARKRLCGNSKVKK